jgi:hypothetical protein
MIRISNLSLIACLFPGGVKVRAFVYELPYEELIRGRAVVKQSQRDVQDEKCSVIWKVDCPWMAHKFTKFRSRVGYGHGIRYILCKL